MESTSESTIYACCMCFDKFPIGNQKHIHCQKCNLYSCSNCFRSYVLHCRNDPPCPNTSCDNVFEISFLRTKLPQAFWNGEYKMSRKDVLFNCEEVYKTNTMIEVQKCKKIREILKRENNQLILYRQKCNELKLIKDELSRLHEGRHAIQHDHRRDAGHALQIKVPCHLGDCLGFCIGNVCPVCSKKTCTKCYHELTDGHECNADDVQTVKEIAAHSKPCPTCNTAISKVDGCDQMLCINCETAFSWRTGKIETGRIHNPHMYQIRQRVGRELGDQLCGGLPSWRQISQAIECNPYYQSSREQKKPLEKYLMIFHRLINHTRAVVFPKFENLGLNFRSNLQARVKFYMNEIDKKTYLKELFKTEKSRTKNMEMRDLFQTFVMVAEEIFRKISNTKSVQHITELYGLFEYMNDNYMKINKKYNSECQLTSFLHFGRDEVDTLAHKQPSLQ